MIHPTHTHKERGGQFAKIGDCTDELKIEGQPLVIYLDLSTQPPATHYIKKSEWDAGWKKIPADACPVCHGSGHDQIKKRKDHPCGGCYGMGKVREDGETPADRWELAEIAGRIISELRCKVARAEDWLGYPPVAEAIEAHQQAARQATIDAQAEQEKKWREGPGHGPGGRRYTGD